MAELFHIFSEWLLLYGAPILFMLLVLGIVGLPIPDETLLTLTGWLVAKGKLAASPMIAAAIAGSICGITISYWLGRSTGSWIIKKYGKKLRITEKKMEKVHKWYERFGKWLLLIGYFLPVIRHLAGYVAGTTNLNIKKFMLFAYTGAILWSITFISLGYFLIIKIPFIRLQS